MMNFLAYCDGKYSALQIAEIIDCPLWKLSEMIMKIKSEGLLTVVITSEE